MRNFRLLKAEEIECRVAQAKDTGIQLLLYKTARTDYAILDESVGAENWQCDYKAVDGKVYCGIGIKCGEEWIWKWNCGSESNMEAEKGEASDAMKRAGFAWGIGTELYSSPFIWVKGADKYDKFRVVEIGYDESQRINRLEIDNTSKRTSAFSFGAKVPKKSDEDRKIIIRTIVTMAQTVGLEDKINESTCYGQPWNEATDETLARIKTRLVELRKEQKDADQ